MSNVLLTTVASAVTGTVLWEGFKFFYPDVQKFFKAKREARKIINENIDPLLKSVDELMAKIYSFSKTDFKEYERYYQDHSAEGKTEIIYTIYLFANFFARLSIIRKESSFINLSSFDRGKNFLNFMYAFEARKSRILTKSIQRSIGDCFVVKNGQKSDVMSILQFKQELKSGNQILIEVIKPLEEALINSKDKVFRQKFYLFGIILQAFIDHFDASHTIIRKREIYLNKLSKKTKADLRFRVFGEYLTFIKDPFEYYKQN